MVLITLLEEVQSLTHFCLPLLATYTFEPFGEIAIADG